MPKSISATHIPMVPGYVDHFREPCARRSSSVMASRCSANDGGPVSARRRSARVGWAGVVASLVTRAPRVGLAGRAERGEPGDSGLFNFERGGALK